jgi:hypothetical protein
MRETHGTTHGSSPPAATVRGGEGRWRRPKLVVTICAEFSSADWVHRRGRAKGDDARGWSRSTRRW